jgi:hypothetical protein
MLERNSQPAGNSEPGEYRKPTGNSKFGRNSKTAGNSKPGGKRSL